MTREEAINWLKAISFVSDHHITEAIDMAKEALKTAPVRCKDCKHRYVTGHTTNYYICDFMDAEYEDNGFCHHGERREE